jgi:hypothetical protein
MTTETKFKMNNPFVTVLLLFCIEIALYCFLDYASMEYDYIDCPLLYSSNEENAIALFTFFTPVVSLLLLLFVKDMAYRKRFQKFVIFISIVSVAVFLATMFLIALGKGWNH